VPRQAPPQYAIKKWMSGHTLSPSANLNFIPNPAESGHHVRFAYTERDNGSTRMDNKERHRHQQICFSETIKLVSHTYEWHAGRRRQPPHHESAGDRHPFCV